VHLLLAICLTQILDTPGGTLFYFQIVNNSNYLKTIVVYFTPENWSQLRQVSKQNQIFD